MDISNTNFAPFRVHLPVEILVRLNKVAHIQMEFATLDRMWMQAQRLVNLTDAQFEQFAKRYQVQEKEAHREVRSDESAKGNRQHGQLEERHLHIPNHRRSIDERQV